MYIRLDLFVVDLPCDVIELWVVHAHEGPSVRMAFAIEDDMVTKSQICADSLEKKKYQPLRNINAIKRLCTRKVFEGVAHFLNQT